MSDQLSPQAEAAYRRAVSAYQQGSYEEAQRWAREALAIAPAHAAAAALLRRLGGGAAGPQVVSTDPTVLIDRGGRSEMAEPQDPTVIVPRKTARPAPPKKNPAPPDPPYRSPGRAFDPTVIVNPSSGGTHTPGNGSFARTPGSLWRRLLSGGGGQDSGFPAARSTSRGRGILIVAGAIAFAAVSVWGVIRVAQGLSADGELLTVEAADGGRIVGDDIRCGSGGSRCSTAIPKGDRVELTAEPDRDYEFAGFTGDCEAGRGILLMDGPKTCSARFEKKNGETVGGKTKYTLSIDKPKGGTILYQEVITCGTLGSDCSEEILAAERVTLRFHADEGYKFEGFSGECESQEFVMNSARTCGGVFIAAAGPIVNNPPPKPVVGAGTGPRSGSIGVDPKQPPPSKGSTPMPTNTNPTPSSPTPSNSGTPNPPVAPPPVPLSPVPPAGSQTPPPAVPDSMEEHAKKEIKQRLDEYCSALETLKPEEVLKVFPRQDAAVLKRQFQRYKSLKCAWTSELTYDRFDIGSAANGSASAQVKVGMKQTSEMHGGGPKAQETTVTIVLSRLELRSKWKIDDIHAEAK